MDRALVICREFGVGTMHRALVICREFGVGAMHRAPTRAFVAWIGESLPIKIAPKNDHFDF